MKWVTSMVRELLRSKSSLTVLMGHAHATQWRTKSSSRRQLSWLRELDQRGGLKKCNFLWVFWHLEFLLNKIFFAWKITSFLIKNEGTPPYAWFNWSRWSTRIVSILPYMVLVNQDEWTHPNDQPESLQYFLYMFPDSWPDPSRTDQEWGNHLNWSGMREPCPNVLHNTHWKGEKFPSFLICPIWIISKILQWNILIQWHKFFDIINLLKQRSSACEIARAKTVLKWTNFNGIPKDIILVR